MTLIPEDYNIPLEILPESKFKQQQRTGAVESEAHCLEPRDALSPEAEPAGCEEGPSAQEDRTKNGRVRKFRPWIWANPRPCAGRG